MELRGPLSFWTFEQKEDENGVKHRESAGIDSYTQWIHYPLFALPRVAYSPIQFRVYDRSKSLIMET